MGKYSDWAAGKAASMKAVGATLTDEEAVQHTDFFMPWRVETEHQAGDRVTYYGTLYKCLQAHTSQSDWTPDAAPSLWAEITLAGEYRVIPEVISASEAFALGERGWWKNRLYESLIQANVYTPDVYPAGWKEVTE